jgi:probable F420-dependent oxidoreductase
MSAFFADAFSVPYLAGRSIPSIGIHCNGSIQAQAREIALPTSQEDGFQRAQAPKVNTLYAIHYEHIDMRRREIPMQRPFRFGVLSGMSDSRAAWIALAHEVEDLGYSTLLIFDRPAMGSLAPLTALAVATQATTTLRVGSQVFCNDFRHPAILAREAATLDLLSDGRLELGLGAGIPPDYSQLGIPFEDPGTRVSRLIESLQIIKALFTEEVVNFTGKYYTITNMRGHPKPIQQPHPPIFIGSSGKRMLSVAARQADIIAITPRPSAPGGPPDTSPEQMLAWVRDAAGERFEQLEFSQNISSLLLTDSPVSIEEQAKALPSFIPRIPMSTAQAIEYLLTQRERYLHSYFQISHAQVRSFAPILAQLAGK